MGGRVNQAMESITRKYDGIHWIFYSSFVSSPSWVVLHGHATVSMSIPRIDLHQPICWASCSNFCLLTGRLNFVEELSRRSTQMRLVCRLWNAVIISTPSLWVQLGTDSQYRSNIPPDILSIWLERSKTCPLHMRLYLPIEPQCLSVLTSSVERWESLELIVLRVHQQISSVDIFPRLVPDDSNTFVYMMSIARCHETLSHS